MKIRDLEMKIGSNQTRLEELKRFDSGQESAEEVKRLEEEISEDLKELESASFQAAIGEIDAKSPLSKALEDAVKGELRISEKGQELDAEAGKLTQEVTEGEKEVLLSEKYGKLMAGISLDSLSEESAEDVRKRMRFLESIDECLEGKNYDAGSILGSLCDKEGNLEIKRALVSDFPDSVTHYQLSEIVNAIADEDPLFESSEEFYKVKKSRAAYGIREFQMFRKLPLDDEEDWPLFKDRPDRKAQKRIVLSKISNCPESLDQFKEGDRQELAGILLAKLSSGNAFHREGIHADSVKNAAERLGISEQKIKDAVKDGFLALANKGDVPDSAFLNSFSDSTLEVQGVLADPEKRAEIMKLVFERVRKGGVSPVKWDKFSSFVGGSAEDRNTFLENFADCSQKDAYEVENVVFGELKKKGDQWSGNLPEHEKSFVFDRISSEAKSRFLASQVDYDSRIERYAHLPFSAAETERSVIVRFSGRGMHTDVYDRELEEVVKNINDHFTEAALSAEQVKDKIFKEQIFSGRGGGVYADSVVYHVDRHKLSFDPREREERRGQITELFSSVLKNGLASGFADAKKLESIFGSPYDYISPSQVYDSVKNRFLGVDHGGEGLRKVSFADLDEVLPFVPKQYRLDILTNSEWQKRLGSMYEDYLANASHSWEGRKTGKNIGFVISKAETYESAENSAFLKLLGHNDLHDMKDLLSKLNSYRPQSPTISALKNHLENNADAFIQDSRNLSTLWNLESSLPGIRDKVKRHAAESLAAIVPGSQISNDEIRNFFEIRYAGKDLGDYFSYGQKFELYTRFFKDSKPFSFYEKMDASYSLYQGGAWDGVYEKTAGMDEGRAESTIALLDMLTRKSPRNFSEVAGFCTVKNLPEMAELFTGLQSENELNSLRISPYLVQRHFDKIIDRSPEEQRNLLIAERCSELIHEGDYRESIRIMSASDISEESVSVPLFQKASQCITRNDFSGLERIWKHFPSLKERFGSESAHDLLISGIQANLNQDASIENREAKLGKLDRLKKAYWVTERFDQLPGSVKEIVRSLEGRHGDKGTRLVSLAIAAYGIENEDRFAERMASIEKVLAFHDPSTIPEGAGVTFGIEYEVGRSVGAEYSKGSHTGYRFDINMLNESCGIRSGGAGGEAIHEIATKPTTNPYLLLAEVKLLQDAEMLDFNFKKYPDASRGYHLNLGGESGLTARSEDMRFLYNMLTMTGCAGLLMGNEVSSVKHIHSKSLDAIGDKRQEGERVEFKGMGGDSFEQFERTVLTAYHAGIASQIQARYLGDMSEEAIRRLPDPLDSFESVPLRDAGAAMTPQEKEILIGWLRLKQDMILAVEQHNNSFLEGEFYGSITTPDGDYKELDLDDNYAAKRVRYFGNEKIDLQKEQERYAIRQSLFSLLTPDFVNALTRSNNLLIFKEPVLSDDKRDKKGRVSANSNAYAFQTGMNAEGYQKNLSGSPFTSIFERDGEVRDGYYPLQGTSEEMITHKSQILLNRFNKKVEFLLRNGQSSNVASRQINYENV